MAFIVKILAGANQGAEALLAERMLIGSGADCDLVLSDAARHQFRLQFDGSKAVLTQLTPPIYVDGEPIAGDGATVLPLQVISFGFVHIAFGDENTNWQAIRLPLIKPETNPGEGTGEGSGAGTGEGSGEGSGENSGAGGNIGEGVSGEAAGDVGEGASGAIVGGDADGDSSTATGSGAGGSTSGGEMANPAVAGGARGASGAGGNLSGDGAGNASGESNPMGNTSGEGGNQGGGEGNPKALSQLAANASQARKPHGKGQRLVLGAFSLVSVLLLVAVLVFVPEEGKAKKPVANPPDPMAEVEKVLASYHNTLKAVQSGSFIQISGFLAHQKQLEKLKQTLQQGGILPSVRFSIQVGDQVAKTLQNSLRAEELNVEVKLSGNTLMLFGVVSNKQPLRKVISDSRLGNFVIKDETVTNGELKNYILASLRQKHFKGHIEVMANKDASISAAGLIGKKDYSVWQQQVATLGKAYPFLVLQDNVKEMPLDNFKLKSVVIGPKTFVTLANGQIVTEGEALKDGFSLAKITDSHLLLKMGSGQYKYIYH